MCIDEVNRTAGKGFMVPSGRTRGMSTKKHRSLPLSIRKGDQALAQVAQIDCRLPIPRNIQKLSECSPG